MTENQHPSSSLTRHPECRFTKYSSGLVVEISWKRVNHLHVSRRRVGHTTIHRRTNFDRASRREKERAFRGSCNPKSPKYPNKCQTRTPDSRVPRTERWVLWNRASCPSRLSRYRRRVSGRVLTGYRLF